jgi:hypothetical protein
MVWSLLFTSKICHAVGILYVCDRTREDSLPKDQRGTKTSFAVVMCELIRNIVPRHKKGLVAQLYVIPNRQRNPEFDLKKYTPSRQQLSVKEKSQCR